MFAGRMRRELELLRSPPPGITARLRDDSDLSILDVEIFDVEAPYSGGVFHLELHVTPRFPCEPPNVRFITPVYHPNIDDGGRICLDLLKMPTKETQGLPSKGTWNPMMKLTTVLAGIRQLMTEPNCNDPLMHDITTEYLSHRDQFMATAQSWTNRHAKDACKRPRSPENVTTTDIAGSSPAPPKRPHVSQT